MQENFKNQSSDIDFQDLEALLQKGLGNAELKLIDHRMECLLPPGENYMSLVVKIDATISLKDGAENEDLNVIAKTRVPTNLDFTDMWIFNTKKEIFAYTQLIPMYRDIEREAGVPEDNLINILPKYMGHRVSRNSDKEYDQDCLILLQNLKVKGYFIADKYAGIDLENAKKALSSLARYHALGIAMKQKRPEFARIAIETAEAKFVNPVGKDYLDLVRKGFQQYSKLNEYLDLIESSIAYMIDKWYSQEPKQVGLWDTITHGDFWTNNILFHKSEDVKFVDWAIYFHVSGLADLVYFLCTSIQQSILNEEIDDLLNTYYKYFVASLERANCDATMFTKESFDKELKKQAVNEIAMSAISIKFIRYHVDQKDAENRELHKNILADEDKAYDVSLMRIIEFYKARKWL